MIRTRLDSHLDREWLLQTLRAAVRIPSVTGAEDAAQEWMADTLRGLGAELDVWRPDVEALTRERGFPGAMVLGSRLNVVGAFRGTGRGPTLVLNGHIDVVSAGEETRWSHPPFAADQDGDRVYGRGAADMKGGLVAALGAIRAIRRAGLALAGTVQIQSVHGEEDGGLGAFAALVRGHRGDGVIVCEPTGLAVVPAHAGVQIFRVSVPGRTAHGCVREEGVSAFERFLPVHAEIKALEAERNRRLRHPLYEWTSLPWPISIGIVTAGIWPSIVPERLTAEGRIGVAVGERNEDARAQLEAAVRHAAQADPWLREHPPTVEWIGGTWHPTETAGDHPLVGILQGAVGQATGKPAVVRGATYASDLRLFTNAFGIPGVLFGPGDIRQAHFCDEYVRMPEVEQASLALALAIVQFCGVQD
jgi:acetylornithine deacetylase